MKIQKNPLRTWTEEQLLNAMHDEIFIQQSRIIELMRDCQDSLHCLLGELIRRKRGKRSRLGKPKSGN